MSLDGFIAGPNQSVDHPLGGRVLTTVDITPRHGFVAASAILTGPTQSLHKDPVLGE